MVLLNHPHYPSNPCHKASRLVGVMEVLNEVFSRKEVSMDI